MIRTSTRSKVDQLQKLTSEVPFLAGGDDVIITVSPTMAPKGIVGALAYKLKQFSI